MRLAVYDAQGQIKTQQQLQQITGDVSPAICQGRLTLTSGTPVTTSDVTAATTVYFTPFRGNMIGTYNGSTTWTVSTFTEKSLSLAGLTANTNYDIFIVDSTLALEAVAWTNDTTRATALVLQDGIYVKSGATTRRYLGTIRITGTTGQCEDSVTKRYVWNYYNRIGRHLRKAVFSSHAYSTAAYRAWNNDTNNKVEFVAGLVEEPVLLSINSHGGPDATDRGAIVGVGYDVTNAVIADDIRVETVFSGGTGRRNQIGASRSHYPGIGYHYYSAVQYSENGQSTYAQFGLNAMFMG